MVAQFFLHPDILQHIKSVISKNIIDAERGRNAGKGSAQSNAGFGKGILHAVSNGMVGITVGYIIEIAAHDHGVRTFIHFFPDPVGLNFSFQKPHLEFAENAF